MAMTKQEAAYLAAGFLTNFHNAGVATDYIAWIDAQVTESTAIVALLAAASSSKSPERVMAKADAYYAALESDPPTIDLLSPATGAAAGGTAVTITGTNLTGTSGVTFGGVAATSVVVVSDTSVTCATPAHAAGAVDVVVTTPAGSDTATGGYTYA